MRRWLAATALAALSAPLLAADPAPFDAVRGDRAGGWTAQSRSEVLAMNGMVATSQPLAAEAGLEVLHAGGNAFDAAVATAAAINVVESEATGIGGDMFVIAWVAKEKRLVALDAAGRAPAPIAPGQTTARTAGRSGTEKSWPHSHLRHCERSEAIQSVRALRLWIASSLCSSQ